MRVLKQIRVTIDQEEVLRLQGYKKLGRIEPMLLDVLHRETEEGYRLIRPKAIYTQLRVRDMKGDLIELENGLLLKAGDGVKAWSGAQHLAVALCTIDAALERRVAQLFEQGEYASALILDSVGSVAVEAVADYVNAVICQRARIAAAEAGRRLSPGYGNWDLTDQRVIFSLLPGEKMGVRLNEQCIMIPRKSVTFCVGIGKGLHSEVALNPCQHCGRRDCPYRRSV